jgi:CheY-like chemotaxis protein
MITSLLRSNIRFKLIFSLLSIVFLAGTLSIFIGLNVINNNATFVDRFKRLVFKKEKINGRDVGATTIFLDDIRVATNVLDSAGRRAIGTQVSDEVYQKVFVEGKDWLGKALAANYDVVVTDLKMPGLGGIEVLKRLHKERPEQVVVVFTGYANVETAREALKNGAFDYIPKPFTPEEIRDVVKNALQARKANGTAVKVRLESRGGEAVLSIHNEGVGIPQEEIEKRLFKRFERLRQKGTEGVKGSGLGLYICKTIVENHGGRIWAESEPGTWVRFSVALPI